MIWSCFSLQKWPKIASRLRILLSYELWKGHLKQVEGHFGTAVVSYFIFLRWLFILNLIIFAFWFGLVVIPQSIWENGGDATSRYANSELTCVLRSDEHRCFGSSVTVYMHSSSCDNTGDQFRARLCRVDDDNIAVGESSQDPITLQSEAPENCTGDDRVLCTERVRPFIEWYQYIFDFVLGQGLFNSTILFHGRYTDSDVGSYNLPVAFLVLAGFVYTVSVVLLVYK